MNYKFSSVLFKIFLSIISLFSHSTSSLLWIGNSKPIFLKKSSLSINLNAYSSINLDTPGDIILESSKVYLGSKDATEPVILGDTFLNDFQKLLEELINLTGVVEKNVFGEAGSGAPIYSFSAQATKTKEKAQNMLNKINNYKSKVSKTK